MIAMRCRAIRPVLIADEPTTALDVTIQAQIIELMNEMQARLGSAIVLITHDLGVVAETCENVLVMYGGNMVEYGRQAKSSTPQDAVHDGLLESLPRLDQAGSRLVPIEGQPPNLLRMPPGCAFEPRCRYRMRSAKEPVSLYDFGSGTSHVVFCTISAPRARRRFRPRTRPCSPARRSPAAGRAKVSQAPTGGRPRPAEVLSITAGSCSATLPT